MFPGIEVVYRSIHIGMFHMSKPHAGNFIEIHHCREGRVEQEYGENFFYLMPGDLSLTMRTERPEEFRFPLNHYHGISIVIDTNLAAPSLSTYLEDLAIQPMMVAKRLLNDKNCFIMRSNAAMEHLFTDLYRVPDKMQKGYLQLKVMELLVLLNEIPLECDIQPNVVVSKEKQALAKQAAAYLDEHMTRRVTVTELSKKFNVSETTMKTAFKSVYGVPVYSYIRVQKMQLAAQMLVHTDKSVMEIANEFGYDNSSKFSAAFREIMGETPSEYRKQHRMK